MRVRKAVIPCAGLGTRFLPATKILPKELLPVVDTPALHYIVEEAQSSGIEQILIILSPQKLYVKDYFKPNRALNRQLQKAGKEKELALVNEEFSSEISFAVQKTMNGNGMAVELAKEFAAGEPFAVLFGDDLVYTGGGIPATKQLASVYETTGNVIIGCQKTAEDVARRCGVMVAGERLGAGVTKVTGIVEKPKGPLPSELVSLGRFILTEDVFDAIERTAPGPDGEVYLSDALDRLAKEKGCVAAYEFSGRRYDIGNKEGYLEATVEYALRDEGLKDKFSEYLKTIY